MLLLQVLHRYLHGEAVGVGKRLEEADEPRRVRARPQPRLHCALCQCQVPVRNDQVGVHFEAVTQAGAGGTRPVGAVEAEGAGLKLPEADVAVNACEMFGEEHLLAAGDVDEHDAPGHLEGALHRVGDAARLRAVGDDQPVNHYLDAVPLLLVEDGVLRKVAHLAVDPDAHVSRLPGVLEHLLVLALAPSDHGREHLYPAAFRQRQHGVHDLLHGLAANGAGRTCSSGACPLVRRAA